MASRQEYFTLLSHGKQVDGTEEEVPHKEPPHHLQAQRGFLISSPNGVRTCSDTAAEDQLIRSQWLTAWKRLPPTYITFECSFISLTSYNINIKKKSNKTDLLPKCCLVNGHVLRVKHVCISEIWVPTGHLNIQKIHILIIMYLKCWNIVVFK